MKIIVAYFIMFILNINTEFAAVIIFTRTQVCNNMWENDLPAVLSSIHNTTI